MLTTERPGAADFKPLATRGTLVRELAACAGLLCYCLLLNHSTLAGNWRWDDPSVLLHLHRFPLLDSFFRPDVWQQYSPANLTPWLLFSYQIDLSLFGIKPEFFYGHQLLALALLACALYRCLALWIARPYAYLASLLLLSSAPALVSAQQLMVRHYVEGGVFALLSLHGYVLYLRQARLPVLVASVACYVLAVSAKEVYVPLVLLLPLLPEADIRQRWRAMLPFLLVVVAYALWRAYMLDSMAGGYVGGTAVPGSEFLVEVLASYASFPRLIFGDAWPFVLVILVVLAASFLVAQPRTLLLGITLVLLCLFPLAPLARFPGIVLADRYLLVVVMVFGSLFVICVERLARLALAKNHRMLATAVMTCAAIVLAASSWQGRTVTAAVRETAQEFDSQAAFIWERDALTAFYPSNGVLPSYWFVVNLAAFKTAVMPDTTAPVAIPDEVYLDGNVGNVFAYDSACACMQPSASSVAEVLAAHRARARQDASLSLEFRYESGYFTWEFGPYVDGEYRVVSDVLGVLPASRAGRLRVTLQEDTPFYLRYTHPDGWMTYSSLQRIHADAPVTRWHRD